MPFLILFGISWLAFGLFADKPRWREFLPASMLAMLMSLTSDVVMFNYPLWVYQDGTKMLTTLQVHLLDDWGIYPVTAFLFVQFFPETKRLTQKWLYFFAWTTGVILLEALFCRMGWMKHQMWWNLFLSYVADWLILFGLLRFSLRFRRTNPVTDNGTPAVQAPVASGESGLAKPIRLNPTSEEIPALVEFFRLHGVDAFELLHHPAVDIYLLEIQPGGLVQGPIHDGEEAVFLIEGEVEVVINTLASVIKPGMIVDLPRDINLCARNNSPQRATLLYLLTPADVSITWRSYTPEQLHSTAHATM